MFRRFSLGGLRRGLYKPLSDDGDGKEGENSSCHAQGNSNSRIHTYWSHIALSAFCGFISALILVNLFPGEMIRTHGNVEKTRLQRLLDGKFYSISD